MKNNSFKFLIFIFIIFLFPFYILITPSFCLSPNSSSVYNGIDVSSWQNYIDFAQVASSGINIVYIKSSESYNIIDTCFEQNYTNAKANGLKVGFYHYLTATNISEALEQAEFFASTIANKSPDCKLAMDFESFNGIDNYSINQIALAFMEKVKDLTGKDTIVYSDTYNATSTFNSTLSNFPLWIAQYDVSEPSDNGIWGSWTGWQYTDQGEVSGVDGYVDMDKFTESIFLSDTSPITNTSNISSDTNTSNSCFSIIIPYGSTLSELAIEYNTTIEKLVNLNNISNPNLIYAGNTLLIPTSASANVSNNSTLYIVKPNDSLSQIALEYGTTISELAYINNIQNVNLIYVGQILKIPYTSHDSSHTLYVVKYGDTLWGISRRYGISIAKIVMLNRIYNPNLIYPGNVLRI